MEQFLCFDDGMNFALVTARRAAVLARRPLAVARRLQPDRKARSLQALFESGWTPAAADSGPVDSYGASAVGRRKSAVANVIVRPGQGVFTVNDRELIDYFVRDTHRDHVIQPFEFTDTLCDFDVTCRVHGGGLSGARAHRAARRVGSLSRALSLGFCARCVRPPRRALTLSFRVARAGRVIRPSRRDPPRRQSCAREAPATLSRGAEVRGPPHARPPFGRAQEARPNEGAQAPPLGQAVRGRRGRKDSALRGDQDAPE